MWLWISEWFKIYEARQVFADLVRFTVIGREPKWPQYHDQVGSTYPEALQEAENLVQLLVWLL